MFRSVAACGVLIAALLTPRAAVAATYYVDVFAPGGAPVGSVPGSGSAGGQTVITVACSAFCPISGFATPFYNFQPGDTINFGSVSLGSHIFTDGRSASAALFEGGTQVNYDYHPGVIGVYPSNISDSCNAFDPSCFPRLFSQLSYAAPIALIFTLPVSATGIQLVWTEPFIYAAPTPIPAALPLFATGLSVLGLLAWRRKRKDALQVTAC